MSSISAALAARAQPPAPAAIPISSGRLAELGSGNPSAGSSAGASNPSPATPTFWEAPAVGGAAGAAPAGPAAAAEDAEDPKAMQAAHCAALLAAVAAVQVRMVLAQLSKKTVSWFAAGARYGPGGEGVVVWVTRGAVTPRKQVEHRAPIGQMPPNLTLAPEARNLAPHPPATGETATAHALQQNGPGSPRPRVDSTIAAGFLV